MAISFPGCYNYEVQITRPSDESSIIFESVYAPISLVRHPLSSSFLSIIASAICPRSCMRKTRIDRERTRFFHIFPLELRISPEETLTALPFPDIFFYCIALQPVNFSSRETEKTSSPDDSRINMLLTTSLY